MVLVHVSWSCCQIFTDIKLLVSPYFRVTSPFLPWQISEKTLGYFLALLKMNPAALEGAWPPCSSGHQCCVCALGLLGSWCITHITRHTLPSFLPPTSTSSAMLSYLCSKVHVVLSLSLPPPPHFLLTAGKNFVHTSSEPRTKLRLVTTTCPSASSHQDGGGHHQTASTPA